MATSRFTPAYNPAGNIVNTGGGPGGLMVRSGPGGLTAGVYGGGWVGPYNMQTGQYGMGGNYGFARPYFGRAQGSAVVLMPANQNPNSPNITYPCPGGRGNGSIISPGVPCGIALTAVPASMLPTMNGMPAAMDITALAVSVFLKHSMQSMFLQHVWNQTAGCVTSLSGQSGWAAVCSTQTGA